MNTIFRTFCLTLLTVALAACNNPNPNPTPDPELTDNSAVYEGVKIEFKSITTTYKLAPNSISILASTDAGITTVEEMIRTIQGGDYLHNHIRIDVNEEKIGQELDLKTSSGYLFDNITSICKEISLIKPQHNTSIQAGTIKLSTKLINNEITAEFSLTPTGKDRQFSGRIIGTYNPLPITQNTISFDNGTPMQFKSIVFDSAIDINKSRLYVLASPVEGITTYDQMMLQVDGVYVNTPLMAYIGHADINKTFNIMTEAKSLFGMANYTGVGSEIVNFNGGFYQYIKAGTFSTTFDQATSTLSLSISVTSKTTDKVLMTNITGKYTPTLSL